MIVCNAPPPWVPASLGLLAEGWRSWYAVANALPGAGRKAGEQRRSRRSDPAPTGTVTTRSSEAEREIYLAQFRRAGPSAGGLARFTATTFAFSARGLRGAFRARRLDVPTLLLFGAR